MDDRAAALWPALVLLIVAASGLVLFHVQRGSASSVNVMSRWATVEALADHGTYAIDDTKYTGTIDKVKIGERFYSSKPPLLPTLVAGVYWVYRSLTGDRLGAREGRAAWVCKLLTVFVWHVLFLVWFARLALRMLQRREAILVAVASAGFAFVGAGYATTLNNHTPAALLGVIAFYYAYRARHDNAPRNRHWLFAGLAAGALPAVDLPSLALTVAIGVYLLLHDRRRTLTWFLAGAAPPLALHLVMTWAVTGSVVPAYLRGELYRYPGSYWDNPSGVYALQQPKWLYAFHVLFGHHGFFAMTPLFVLGTIAVVRSLVSRDRHVREAVALAAVGLVLLAFYVFRTNNYGGVCVGVRWLVAYMPFLFLFLGVWIDRIQRLRVETWALVVVLFLVSQFHALDALDSPWKEARWHTLWRAILGTEY